MVRVIDPTFGFAQGTLELLFRSPSEVEGYGKANKENFQPINI